MTNSKKLIFSSSSPSLVNCTRRSYFYYRDNFELLFLHNEKHILSLMECVCSVGHSIISFLLLLLRNYKSLHSVTVLRGSNFYVTLYSNPELRCNYRDVGFIVNHRYSRKKLYVLLIVCFYIWTIICLRDKFRVISFTKISIFNK